MTRPRLLELFSCASGAGEGYRHAGFDLIGVDIEPQPNYPRPAEFIQADALDVLRDKTFVAGFDAIHASPPCQAYSNLNAYNHKTYPDLIAPVRELILESGLPYVIENVEAAASELKDPVMLCGPLFGLKVYRHRLFETNWPLAASSEPKHLWLCARNGYLPTPERPFMTITGGKHSRAWQNAACDAMDMPWIKVPAGGDTKLGIREVCEAIPPAYTEFIGAALLADKLERRAAA
jgi:DNA (cytosine-5)-methyltransferase 1